MMKIEKLTIYAAEFLLREPRISPRLKYMLMAPKSRKGPWVIARVIRKLHSPDEPFVRFWILDPKTRRELASCPRYWRPMGIAHDPGQWEFSKRTMRVLRRDYEKFKDWPERYAREGLPLPQLIGERVYLLGKFLPEYDNES